MIGTSVPPQMLAEAAQADREIFEGSDAEIRRRLGLVDRPLVAQRRHDGCLIRSANSGMGWPHSPEQAMALVFEILDVLEPVVNGPEEGKDQ